MSSTVALWLYRCALATCPSDFRRRFGARMLADFRDLLAEARTARSRLGIALREAIDVGTSAWRRDNGGTGGARFPHDDRPTYRDRVRLVGDDLLFAARALRARRGYAVVSVLTLALGIGATTTVFSVIDKVVIQPLPYVDSERIVYLFANDLSSERGDRFTAPPADYLDWQSLSTTMSHVEAHRSRSAVLTAGSHPLRIAVTSVSDGTFDMLGVAPVAGVPLGQRSADHDLVLTYGTWQQAFGGDPDVIGRSVELDGAEHTVVGIMPPGFRHPSASRAAMFQPLRLTPDEAADRSSRYLMVLGKLRPDSDREQALAEFRAITASLASAHPQTNTNWGINVMALKDVYVTGARAMYAVLAAAAALVLLIACVNLASLVLARGAARRTELAVRMALGAGRARLVRLLLAEGTVVAVGGLVLGMLVAAVGLAAILPLAPTWPLALRESTLTSRGVLFACMASGASLVIFALLPGLGVSRLELGSSLGGATRSVGGSQRDLRFRRGLVVAQLAVAVVLMIGAGLLIRSVVNIVNADSGFDYRGVVSARLLAASDEGAAVYFNQLQERARSLPGVSAAALVDAAPMDGSGDWMRVYVDGERVQAERALGADYRRVSTNYFDTLAIDRVAGRLLTEADAAGGRVAVVNEDFARRLLPGRDPIGARVALAPAMGTSSAEVLHEWRIVGVVETVQEWGPTSFLIPIIYVPHQADPTVSMSLLLRTDRAAETLLEPLRAIVAEVGNSPIDRLRALSAYFQDTYATQRFLLALLSAFAALAALLAGVGLYGVMAYHVVQRHREIGVRVAMGAARDEIARMVLRQGAGLAIGAVLLGVAGAVPLSRALSVMSMGRMLVDVYWLDPIVFAAVPLFVLATGVLASWLPARRAARIDPIEALRSET